VRLSVMHYEVAGPYCTPHRVIDRLYKKLHQEMR